MVLSDALNAKAQRDHDPWLHTILLLLTCNVQEKLGMPSGRFGRPPA